MRTFFIFYIENNCGQNRGPYGFSVGMLLCSHIPSEQGVLCMVTTLPQ